MLILIATMELCISLWYDVVFFLFVLDLSLLYISIFHTLRINGLGHMLDQKRMYVRYGERRKSRSIIFVCCVVDGLCCLVDIEKNIYTKYVRMK